MFGGSRLALVPPRPSVLPPGAGNEAKKALKADKERANEVEQGVLEVALVHGHRHAATVARDDDGDAAAIPTVELRQR